MEEEDGGKPREARLGSHTQAVGKATQQHRRPSKTNTGPLLRWDHHRMWHTFLLLVLQHVPCRKETVVKQGPKVLSLITLNEQKSVQNHISEPVNREANSSVPIDPQGPLSNSWQFDIIHFRNLKHEHPARLPPRFWNEKRWDSYLKFLCIFEMTHYKGRHTDSCIHKVHPPMSLGSHYHHLLRCYAMFDWFYW